MPKISIKKPIGKIIAAISRSLGLARDFYLMPGRCPVCGEVVEAGAPVLCTRCLLTMPLCSAEGYELLERRAMLHNAVVPVAGVWAYMNYDPTSPYAAIIRTLKYRGRPDIGREMGVVFAERLLARPAAPGQPGLEDIDVLLPMPMHALKRFRRGYNQAEEITRGMAERCGAAVADNLVAVRPHSTQTRLDFSHRARNLSGCFELRHPEELDGLDIAIVDDIITTGASMAEALMAISRAGATPRSVSLLALGVTSRG